MFVFVFNDTLDDGTRLARSRVRLMKRIARLFRDPDTRHIVLSRVDQASLWKTTTMEESKVAMVVSLL